MEWDSTLLNEDDSLLQPNPPRIGNPMSPMKYSRIPEDSVKDNYSSSKDTSNKENISVNKSEGPKLNVEPVQMKKKRKGGGYNLRKSLAWDRAFFTEEGVLDPLELSMISGTHVNSSREGLSTINEDDSLSNDYQSNTDSADLRSLEKNLFKEVPAASLKKDIENVYLPPKHNSPARARRASSSVASPKVLPTRGASFSGSRGGGCPRPLPLSSLKRPANINACQAVTKESKLPRIPVSKPGHSSTLGTNKGVTQGALHVKQRQITQPVVNIQSQRNVGLKSSPKSVKYSQNKPKAVSGYLPVKSSALHSKRNVVNSQIYPHASAQLNPPIRNKVTNSGPKLVPDDVGPSTAVPPSECQGGSTQLPASLPRDASTANSTKQHKQFPSMKPSGLRMPSPSLGFFGQPKSSVPHCALQRAVEGHIPGLRKLGNLRLPHSPVRIPEVVDDIMQTVDTVVLRSGSDLHAASHERMKQNIAEDAVKEGLKFSVDYEPSKPMNNKNTICTNSDSGILGFRESKKSIGSDSENFELLPQQNSTKCAKGDCGTRNQIENSCEGKEPSDSAISSNGIQFKSHSRDVITHDMQISAATQSNPLSCLQDLHHVTKEQCDRIQCSTGETVGVPHGDEHLLVERGSYNEPLGDSQNHTSENLENADFETPACTEIELKSLCSSSQERCEKLEETLIEDDMTLQSNFEETELQKTDIFSTSRRCKNNLDPRSEVVHLNELSGKTLELQTQYLLENSQNNHRSSAAGCVFVEKGSEDYTQEVTEMLPFSMLDVRCKSELDSSDEISQVPVGTQSELLDISKIVGEALVEDLVQGSVEIPSSVENHNHSFIANVGSDVVCRGEITSSDFNSALNEASNSLVTDECGTFNGDKLQKRQVNENDLMVEEPENLTSFGPCLESEVTDVNCGSLLAENKFPGEDQNCDLQNIPEADPIVYNSSRTPLGKSNTLEVANSRQRDEGENRVNNSSNLFYMEDELGQEPDCNLPVECHTSRMQVVSDQCGAVAPTEKSGEAGLPNFCILAENFPQINQSLIPENCFSRERAVLAEFEENNVFERGVDAVSETIDTSGNELESFRAVSGTPLPMHVSGDDGEKFHGTPYIVHTTLGCEEVEPSSESYRPFTGSWMKHDMEHGGLLVEDLTSSRNKNQEASRLKKGTLPDDTKAKVAQDIDSLAEESHSVFNVALCLMKDKDTTAPIKKSESSSSKNSLTVIPPTNAAPFSDEWLATMEAAGEDILKVKSGAVQNSPTEKALSEPSPWSPVRRKNNPIGPYDCTKFTNNLPSHSQ